MLRYSLCKSCQALYTVSKLMGHSTIAMTERYAHLAPDTLKKAVEKLEDSLSDYEDNKILSIERSNK